MDSSDNIRIISKEKETIELDRKIVEFCEGLAIYDLEEDIDLSETASSQFLNTLKDFYENNEYDKEKLKVIETVQGNDLQTNLINETNFKIMEKFYNEALENKNMDNLLDLSNGAELLRALEFLNLVTVTIATIIFCPEGEQEQKDYCKKWGLDNEKPSEEVIKELEDYPELHEQWKVMDKEICDQFKNKLKELLCPDDSDTEDSDSDSDSGMEEENGKAPEGEKNQIQNA